MLITKEASADPVEPGTQLTYTIKLINTGSLTITAVVTDYLPGQVTPTGIRNWGPLTLSRGDTWETHVVVTTDADYTGRLSNIAQAVSTGGLTDTITIETSTIYQTYLPLMFRSSQ